MGIVQTGATAIVAHIIGRAAVPVPAEYRYTIPCHYTMMKSHHTRSHWYNHTRMRRNSTVPAEYRYTIPVLLNKIRKVNKQAQELSRDCVALNTERYKLKSEARDIKHRRAELERLRKKLKEQQIDQNEQRKRLEEREAKLKTREAKLKADQMKFQKKRGDFDKQQVVIARKTAELQKEANWRIMRADEKDVSNKRTENLIREALQEIKASRVTLQTQIEFVGLAVLNQGHRNDNMSVDEKEVLYL